MHDGTKHPGLLCVRGVRAGRSEHNRQLVEHGDAEAVQRDTPGLEFPGGDHRSPGRDDHGKLEQGNIDHKGVKNECIGQILGHDGGRGRSSGSGENRGIGLFVLREAERRL